LSRPSLAAPAPAAAAAPAPAGDDDGDGPEPDAAALAAAAAALAAAPLGRAKEAAIAESIANPLAALGAAASADGADRKKIFFEQMKRTADEKRVADEARKSAKFAAMTVEEREDFAREQQAEERHKERQKRLVGQIGTTYGSGAAKAALMKGSVRKVMLGRTLSASSKAAESAADAADGK